MYKEIKKCRISESENLTSVLDLGRQYLAGIFPESKEQKVSSGPLELVWCSESRLLQLKHSYPLDEMYGNNYDTAVSNWFSIHNPLTEKMLMTGEGIPEEMSDEHTRSILYRDALGVSAAITPWNFPMLMPQQCILPSLMAGNCVVFKPSEETPLVGQAYADVLNEFLPENVLQIVHGADDQGKALVASDINLVAFTGSREVGSKILTACGPELKRVVLELGGKDALIVLEDADIDAAASFAVQNSFRNSGQVCVSTERIYVDESIADDFETLVIEKTKDWKQGDPTDETVKIGPMVSSMQRDIVLAQLEQALKDGAVLRCGGETKDNYIEPTVLTGCSHDMQIMHNETFGPICCIQRFENDAQAVALANETPYGLGGAVYGETQHAMDVARKLTPGMVGINKGCGGSEGTPWVGACQSGYGYHSGRDGHRQFTQVRIMSMPITEAKAKY